MTPAQRASLTDEERSATLAALDAYEHDWTRIGRTDQQLPPGAWQTWLILAGRGWGKTRTGAETTRRWVRDYPYVNLIGATADDARDIMIEGESGILAVCSKAERPYYAKTDRQLRWPNGAKSLIFTADEPERLRGKQHMKLWADEVAAWRYEESWTQAMLGLRLGNNPQAIATTTPRPRKLILELLKDPRTVPTRGSTFDNRKNLARQFIDSIVRSYEGTRIGRQELYAEILDDAPGALWRRDEIDSHRVKKAPQLDRIVVAIDPAVSDSEDSCETGIVVVGVGDCSCMGTVERHAFVLGDVSGRYSPNVWANKALEAYHDHQADRIVAEVNQGGALVESNLRTVDKNVPYTAVRASRGKRTRAEPVSALYEQGKVHHVGSLPTLEDQMCQWDPTMGDESPDRVDALVWALTELIVDGPRSGTSSSYDSPLTLRDRDDGTNNEHQSRIDEIERGY